MALSIFPMSLLYRFQLFLLLAFVAAHAQQDSLSSFFYRGLDYGSQAQFNPLSVIASEAWDISQMENRTKSVLDMAAPEAFGRLNGSISHPLESIRRTGTKRFLTTEIVPTSFAASKAQWIPNYQLHLIGSGMRNAALEEWWTSQGCTHPGIAAVATTYLAQYMNEVSEISAKRGHRDSDPVADLYVFDLAGILLFQPQAVREFFSQTVEMAYWPLQSTWQPTAEVNDAGAYWSFKIPLPKTESWKLFYYMGLGNIGGLTHQLSGGDALSVGAGAYARVIHSVDSCSSTATLGPKLGVFWDRKGSLMASAFYNSQSVERFLVNLYPGVLPTGPVPLGCWVSQGRRGIHMGLTTRFGFGAGV